MRRLDVARFLRLFSDRSGLFYLSIRTHWSGTRTLSLPGRFSKGLEAPLGSGRPPDAQREIRAIRIVHMGFASAIRTSPPGPSCKGTHSCGTMRSIAATGTLRHGSPIKNEGIYCRKRAARYPTIARRPWDDACRERGTGTGRGGGICARSGPL